MSSQLFVLDTRDDRIAVWHLLHRLPPRDRIGFLKWACTQVPQNAKGHLPVPHVRGMRATCDQAYRCDSADRALTNECYADILILFSQWNLDAMKTAVALEARVKYLSRAS